MFEEPEDDNRLNESASDPAVRAKEKADEYRIHAEIYAVFEGTRKFDAQLHRLDSSLARDIQKRIGKLEKERSPETPLLPGPLWGEAMEALKLPQPQRLATNDYHVNRRPGEVLIVR